MPCSLTAMKLSSPGRHLRGERPPVVHGTTCCAARIECLRTSWTRAFTADACSSAGAGGCAAAPPSSSPSPRPHSPRRCITGTPHGQHVCTVGAARTMLPTSVRQALSSLAEHHLHFQCTTEEDCTHTREHVMGAAGLTCTTADRQRVASTRRSRATEGCQPTKPQAVMLQPGAPVQRDRGVLGLHGMQGQRLRAGEAADVLAGLQQVSGDALPAAQDPC